MTVKRTERGWPGHYICANYCLFRRNTLLEKGDLAIIVSTVGNMFNASTLKRFQAIGGGIFEDTERVYETMCFVARLQGKYMDADVMKDFYVDNVPKSIIRKEVDDNVDNKANDMHENYVSVVAKLMETGEIQKYLDFTYLNEEDNDMGEI